MSHNDLDPAREWITDALHCPNCAHVQLGVWDDTFSYWECSVCRAHRHPDDYPSPDERLIDPTHLADGYHVDD